MIDYLVYTENEMTYLVDSGSPFSVNYGSSTLGSTIEKIYPGLLLDLSENLKRKIDGIIGTDQLSQYRWHFDPMTSKLTRITDEFDLGSYQAYKLEKHLGLPVINALVDLHDYRLIIDTCSTLNYLKPSLLSGTSVSTIEDYHPMLGKFETHGYKKSIYSFDRKVDVLMYDLPGAMEMTLGSDVHGILGCRFMSHYEWVMDLRQSTWWLNRREPLSIRD